jgi:hypothetical protein
VYTKATKRKSEPTRNLSVSRFPPETTREPDQFFLFSQAALRRTQGEGNSQDNLRKVQGNYSEDEALARALAASMNQQQNPITVGDAASSQDKNKCSVS